MRERIYEGVNGATEVFVLDKPGMGGACHHYMLAETEEAAVPNFARSFAVFEFQKGPIAENGINGVQIEDLLAVCKHRLEGFQAGKFSSIENERALKGINYALRALEDRTRDRQSRGVEGRDAA